MVLSTDTLTLVFYIMQQLGMMLGFGAEVILLFTYLFGKRNGVINDTEDRIAHGIYRVLLVALFLIVISGVCITATYFVSGQTNIVFQPAYLFKWALIAIAVVLAILLRGARIWNSFFEGFAGANWGALFLIHIFAPITTILILLDFYGILVSGFLCIWYLLVFILRPKLEVATPAPTPVSPIKPPLPPQKIIMDVPRPPMAPTPQKPPVPRDSSQPIVIPAMPQRIILDPEALPGLPTIRVMPKTEQELEQQTQPSTP